MSQLPGDRKTYLYRRFGVAGNATHWATNLRTREGFVFLGAGTFKAGGWSPHAGIDLPAHITSSKVRLDSEIIHGRIAD